MIGRVVVHYDWQISSLCAKNVLNYRFYRACTLFTILSIISVGTFAAVRVISSYSADSPILARVVCARVH